MPDSVALSVLTDLRKKAGLSLSSMAERCGLRGRYGHQSAGAWERGESVPDEKRRRHLFIGYLWDDLRLRRDKQRFVQIWSLLVQEWGWAELRPEEWQEFAPGWAAPEPNHGRVPRGNALPQSSNSVNSSGKVRIVPQERKVFVGRKTELDNVTGSLIRKECRLLTLVGPGGIGKTRLALASIKRLSDRFTHGVCFVSLAAVEDRAGLIAALFKTLNLAPAAESNWEQQLIQWLQPREILLVLDNFEQLRSQVDFVRRVLESTNRVKLLLTSRVRINLDAEWVIGLSGLERPPARLDARSTESAPSNWNAADEMMDYGAVQLFVHHAKRVRANFRPTPQDLGSVSRICHLVGGMPLAIELAASWIPVLSVEEILTELENSPDILSTSMSDVSERHRSIRAVFESSWRQLSSLEQTALMQLSILRGGFTRQTAASVAQAHLPILVGLIDKSFLNRTASGRYEMHELLRQLLEEQLVANPELNDQTRASCATLFADFLCDEEKKFSGIHAAKSIRMIEEELQNIRVCWWWMAKQLRTDDLDRAMQPLYLFFTTTDRHHEGMSFFRYACQQHAQNSSGQSGEESGTLVLAKLKNRLAEFQFNCGQQEEALTLLHEAHDVIRQRGNRREKGFCLLNLGSLSWQKGAYDAAENYLEEAMHLYEADDNREGIAQVLVRRGVIAFNRGDLLNARRLYQMAHQIAQSLGHLTLLGITQHNLGQVCQALGEFAAAKAHLEEGLRSQKTLGAGQNAAYMLISLATVASQMGKHDRARELAIEALTWFQEMVNQSGSIRALRQLGDTCRMAGDFANAASYLKRSLELAREIHSQPQQALCICSQGKLKLDEGDYEQARQLGEQALHLCRTIGIQAGVGYSRNLLGQLHLAQGQHVEALANFQQGLAIGEETKAVLLAQEALLGIGVILAECAAPFAAAVMLYNLSIRSSCTEECRREAQRWLGELVDTLDANRLEQSKVLAGSLPDAAIVQAAENARVELDVQRGHLLAFCNLEVEIPQKN